MWTDELSERRREDAERILAFIRQYPYSPLSRVFNTRAWGQGQHGLLHRQKLLKETVLEKRRMELMRLSMRELYEYFCRVAPGKLLFNAPEARLAQHYYSIEESVRKMEQLLHFQFDSEDEIVQFLVDVYYIISKRLPKKNTLFILSPPNAGKKWFFNSVVHFFLDVGEIRNVDGPFALQGVVDKRIVLWENPTIHPFFMGTVKTMLGGDSISVPVRGKRDALVMRTPVIVLSTRDVFPHDLAFDTRLIRYEWKAFPQLESFVRQPHPMAVYKLLEKWDIFDITSEYY